MLKITYSFVLIILNISFLLPITEEVHVCISSCVMYYFKFDQELRAFLKVLTEWSLTRT